MRNYKLDLEHIGNVRNEFISEGVDSSFLSREYLFINTLNHIQKAICSTVSEVLLRNRRAALGNYFTLTKEGINEARKIVIWNYLRNKSYLSILSTRKLVNNNDISIALFSSSSSFKNNISKEFYDLLKFASQRNNEPIELNLEDIHKNAPELLSCLGYDIEIP